MYLESITIENYRKFNKTDNQIFFVKPELISIKTEENNLTQGIAPSTTLIIGKNNTGKTTIINALSMLRYNEQPQASDFNLSYLNELFNEYKVFFENNKLTSFEGLETPNLKFIININISFNDEDLMSYLAPFIPINKNKDNKFISIPITIKLIISEESIFKENVSNIFKTTNLEDKKLEKKQQFEKFYSLLSKNNNLGKLEGNLYKTIFLDSNQIKVEAFSLKKLINIKEIKANRHLKSGVLSEIFNKIVGFQFTNDPSAHSDLEKSIKLMNKQISDNVGAKSSDISQILSKIENTNKVNLDLSGNVTYDAIMKGLIKYNFMDDSDYIPEDQFGLGYINLINIIGEIIHFVDSYEEKSHFSCINLLFIEEPEVFMHPQMQEFFIKRIDNAVIEALELTSKSSTNTKILQCQIVITTHSSHIVNSKIHSSNTFNNLNYLISTNKCTKAINLTDEAIFSGEKEADKKLKFIKKHIKYKVSELFFSDAVIFVEGITEETLLAYYLENHPTLCNYYISIFNINGAHGKLYLPLAKKLSIPCLIITDLDIKREKCEKNEIHTKNESCNICGQQAKKEHTEFISGSDPTFAQIRKLEGRRTTNSTLKEFNLQLRNTKENDADKLDDIEFFEDDDFFIIFQKDSIEGQYATSLEEALILTNYQNDIINNAIKECKPKIYNDILNKSNPPRKGLIDNSYKLQNKLSDSKSEFSNILLFSLISAEISDDIPNLPNYINDGLNWLVSKLQSNDSSSLNDAVVPVYREDINNSTIESVEVKSDDRE
ncbi:AAA family ATPase [Proteus terrae]|uniref:AAA family ATPase n=1 Tax=Proteus terrae TaxID=1574161 RepID=UPI000D6986AC|nr:AAA family ATPase [Proteus terrae]